MAKRSINNRQAQAWNKLAEEIQQLAETGELKVDTNTHTGNNEGRRGFHYVKLIDKELGILLGGSVDREEINMTGKGRKKAVYRLSPEHQQRLEELYYAALNDDVDVTSPQPVTVQVKTQVDDRLPVNWMEIARRNLQRAHKTNGEEYKDSDNVKSRRKRKGRDNSDYADSRVKYGETSAFKRRLSALQEKSRKRGRAAAIMAAISAPFYPLGINAIRNIQAETQNIENLKTRFESESGRFADKVLERIREKSGEKYNVDPQSITFPEGEVWFWKSTSNPGEFALGFDMVPVKGESEIRSIYADMFRSLEEKLQSTYAPNERIDLLHKVQTYVDSNGTRLGDISVQAELQRDGGEIPLERQFGVVIQDLLQTIEPFREAYENSEAAVRDNAIHIGGISLGLLTITYAIGKFAYDKFKADRAVKHLNAMKDKYSVK